MKYTVKMMNARRALSILAFCFLVLAVITTKPTLHRAFSPTNVSAQTSCRTEESAMERAKEAYAADRGNAQKKAAFDEALAQWRRCRSRQALTNLRNSKLAPEASGGPDTFGHTWRDNQGANPVPYQFVDISGTGTLLGSGDDQGFPYTLQAPFSFYGAAVTSVAMATNGYISTDSTDDGPDLSNDCPLPAPPSTGGGARMYALHDDLVVSDTGGLFVQYFATCPRPNDYGGCPEACTVFQWQDVTHFGEQEGSPQRPNAPFNFQAILYHTRNEIVYQIGAGNAETGGGSTTGIQNAPPPTDGLRVACNVAGSIPDNYAVAIFAPNATSCCTLTCPTNITASNDPGQCGAVVNFAPTSTAGCGTVTCMPPSGAFFPVGMTSVTCTTTAGSMCSFTVTVNDTQPPTIACPTNQTVASMPNGSATVVTYLAPTATDNCPGVTVACNPAAGSTFAVGTTTVTCKATDAANNMASCTFTVTVTQFTPAPTMSLVDPLACNGQGDVVNGMASVTNSSGINQTGTLSTALPAGLIGIPNTCVATVGTCTINATTVSWSGTLTPGQSVSYSYNAQIADNVPQGTMLTATTTATFGAISQSVTASLTVNCPAVGPGLPPGANNALSDQKPGSVLFYNLVSSSATNASTQNARISLTNTNTTRTAFIHLFFVDGATCGVADSFICLTPNQTATVLHSDIDPGVTGYLVAVATDRNGCPINFNYLIGDEYVKLSSGHAANLAAESIAARAGGATFCAPTASDAVLAFNDVAYDAVPRVLALDNFASPADGNQTLLVVNRVGGYLSTGAFTTGTLFGILYDDAEQALSFSLPGACQVRANLNGSTIRTTPRVEQFVPTGRTGWLKLFNNLNDVGLLGAALNFNANAGTQAAAFNQGHNLHKLRLSQAAVYTIPIFPPSC